MVLGVAGKYCAGKDTVVRFLQELGYREINVDKLGHQALEHKKKELAQAFGNGIFTQAGHVDRPLLGKIVFEDPAAKKRLESIVHPWMYAEVCAEVKKQTEAARAQPAGRVKLIINAALLFPMGLAPLCDAVIWVWAPFLWRLARARARDKLTLKAALSRLLSQSTNQLKSGEKSVDMYYVGNWCMREGLRRHVTRIVSRLQMEEPA